MDVITDDWSKNDFNILQWINDVLAAKKEDISEGQVNQLIEQLEQKKKNTCIQLKNETQKIYNDFPEIIQDVCTIQKSIQGLKQGIHQTKSNISRILSENGTFIDSLADLNNSKLKLEKLKLNLQQVENWNVFEKEIQHLLELGDYEIGIERVSNIKSSLNLLPTDPEWQKKREMLLGLQSSFLDIAADDFASVLISNDKDKCQKLVKIFKEFNQEDILSKQYQINYSKELHDIWVKSANRFLTFFDSLCTNWLSNVNFLETVCFTNPALILMEELDRFLQNTQFETGDNLIDLQFSEIIDLKNGFCSFLKIISTHIKDEKHEIAFDKLSRTVFQPFNNVVKNLCDYEKDYLREQIVFEMNEKSIRKMDFFQLNLNLQNVKNCFRIALKRCADFSEYVTLNYFLDGFRQFFRDYYFTEFKTICKLLLNENFKRVDERWNLIQIPVEFLKHCGDLVHCLQQLNDELISSIKSHDFSVSSVCCYLLDDTDLKLWTQLRQQIVSETYVFGDINTDLVDLCTMTYDVLIQMLMKPIGTQFQTIYSTFSGSATNDLSHFRNQPQEYITLIGQYLITLPQHLESLISKQNQRLVDALQLANVKCDTVIGDDGFEADIIFILIDNLSQRISDLYCDVIFDIKRLNDTNCEQLVTDIKYLENVLEDLGTHLSKNLTDIATLLVVPEDRFSTAASGISTKITFTIKQIRNLSI